MSYQEPTTIHLLLGIVAFCVFILLVVADAHPDYSVSVYLSAMLVGSYLILLGFGLVLQRLLEVRYGPREQWGKRRKRERDDE